jgi:bacillithiol system protein YtxJ
MNWIELSDLNQLDEIESLSSNQVVSGVAVFKHSTRCGTSSFVKKMFERSWDENSNIPVYHLDLIRNKNISNEIALRWKVNHESPQLIVLKGNKVAYRASHSSISASKAISSVL